MGSPLTRASAGVMLAVVLTVPATGRALARSARTPRSGAFPVHAGRPRSPFDCEPATGRDSRASAERCLREACAGENVTNEFTHDRDGRIRRNPCYGRSPFEPERWE